MDNHKHYIGDGVYVSFDGYQLCLETRREFGHTDRIYLEPHVYAELLAYVERLKSLSQEAGSAETTQMR